nr:hypothetical protein [Microbacterium sp. NIBRBAC000506063]
MLEELVHLTEPGQQIVGAGGGAGEEQFEGGVVAAVAVQLRGDLSGLARGVLGDPGLRVGLLLQLRRLLGGLEERLLRFVVLVRRALGGGVGLLDAVGERADQTFDAGDLPGLGRLVRPGLLDVVPAGVGGGVRRGDPGGETEGAESGNAQDTRCQGAAAAHRHLRPERAGLCGRGAAAALVRACLRGIRPHLLWAHASPRAISHHSQ